MSTVSFGSVRFAPEPEQTSSEPVLFAKLSRPSPCRYLELYRNEAAIGGRHLGHDPAYGFSRGGGRFCLCCLLLTCRAASCRPSSCFGVSLAVRYPCTNICRQPKTNFADQAGRLQACKVSFRPKANFDVVVSRPQCALVPDVLLYAAGLDDGRRHSFVSPLVAQKKERALDEIVQQGGCRDGDQQAAQEGEDAVVIEAIRKML